MECFNDYYLEDNVMKKCEEFNEELIKKGKCLYEVIRIIDGVPLFLEKHLNRFFNSSKLENLNLWYDKQEIKESIDKVIKKNNIKIGNVKLVFNFNERVFLCYLLKYHYPSDKDYKVGVDTILYHGERENPNAKIINTNFRQMVTKEIKDANAYEAILVDNNGYITEGSKSNIFMVKESMVITAPLEAVLPGVTRGSIIDLCKKLNIEFKEEKIRYEDINTLDALFISGTSPKVLPIKKVDNINFDSSNNEIILKLIKEYDEKIKKDITEYKSNIK